MLAADVLVRIVSSESLEKTQAAVREKKLDGLSLLTVDASLWSDWGILNEKRPDLPRPTTFVVAPDGTLVWKKTTAEYSDRISVNRVMKVVKAHRAGEALEVEEPVSDEVNYEDVLQVSAAREGKWVRLQLEVDEGWHTYGKAEGEARRLSVSLDGERVKAKIPRKAEVTGEATVSIKTTVNEGVLAYQVCSGGVCSPPLSLAWSVAP